MNPDVEQGIAIELKYILKSTWTFALNADRFIVVVPTNEAANDVASEIWRITRFIAYSAFVSIAKRSDGSYHIFSKSESGSAFEIVFTAEAIASDTVT